MTPSAMQMHISDLVDQDEAERRDQYVRAWAAYDGEGPKPLKVEDDDADDNIRLDYPELIVDKGVSFLVGKDGGVSVQVKADPAAEVADEDPDEDDEGEDLADPGAKLEERATAELDRAWPLHQRQLDFHNLATNGGVCGHAWFRIYSDGRVSVLDPGNCSVDWNSDDVSIVDRYRVEWNTVDEDTGMGVVRRWRIEPDTPAAPKSWTIWLEELDDDTGQWVELEDPTPWPHDFAPIVEGQNLPAPNTFYGRADLEPAILDMVEQLESLASDMRRIARLHGHPIPVVIGEDANRLATIDVSIGELLAIPAKKTEAELDQLAIAELTSLLELYTELKTALFEAARIPKIALGETSNAGPTSGVALKVEYEPLVEKTGTKRLTYGYMISETARRVLALRGVTGVIVSLAWPELLPSDPKADAESDEAEQRMGIVSKQTLAERRGYDWEVEQERLAEEAEAGAGAMARAFNEGRVEE